MSDFWHSGPRPTKIFYGPLEPPAGAKIPGLADNVPQQRLDLGCGTGAMTQQYLTRYAPKEVFAIDFSKRFKPRAADH